MLRPGIRRYLRLPLRRRDGIEEQVDEEIELHIEMRIEQLMRRGQSREEAEGEATRRFGTLRIARRRLRIAARRKERTMGWRETLDSLRQDTGYVLRTLYREPGFTAMIVLTLALGIGANAAMFGIIDRLLLRGPEHIVDADRVQRFYITSPADGSSPEQTYASSNYVLYTSLRDQGRAFERVAAYTTRAETLGRGATSEQVRLGVVTWDFFPLLGVAAQRGRFFGEAEDRPFAAEPVVVLSHELWQRRFNGEDVIGRVIELGSRPFTVIGVAPRDFTGVRLEQVDLWVSMSAFTRVTADWPTTWRAQWLRIVARLKPGITAEAAGQDATRVLRAVYPADHTNWRSAVLSLRPLHFSDAGREPTELAVARWLIGVSAVVLLIACANVANLLLARALRRRREIAVRVVLGISRPRLVRLLLTESMVLAGLGALAGLGVAHWGGHFMRVLLLPNVYWSHAPVSTRVFAFSVLAALVTGLLIGLVPVAQATLSSLGVALKAGTREGGGRRSRMRNALTIAQGALSVVLLVGAGLFVRSLWNVRHLDLGLEPDRVLHVSAAWPPPASSSDGRARATPLEGPVAQSPEAVFWDRALERVRALPGVTLASTAVGTPFNSTFGVFLRVPGRDSIPRMPGGGPYVAAIQRDFLETLGIELLRGRHFTDADRAGSERVAIVNQLMARTLWPDQDPIGQCLIIGADSIACARIVGVVEDARRYELREEPAMQYYVPLGQETGIGGRTMVIRPRGNVRAFMEPLRRELQQLEPEVLYFNIFPLQQALDPQVRPWRLGATMFAIFGGLALLIAAIGLYSVIAYLVSQRRQELGVRMALGAQSADIMQMVLRQGLLLTAIGVGLGLLFALAGGRFLADVLFDTSPRDPSVLISVVVTLLAASALACWLPARRATRVNPVEALRSE